MDVECEVPPPKLLVATDQALLNIDFDIRFNKTIYNVPENKQSIVRDLALLKRENLIFITNSLNEIVVINGSEEHKVIKSNLMDYIHSYLK